MVHKANIFLHIMEECFLELFDKPDMIYLAWLDDYLLVDTELLTKTALSELLCT